MLKSKSQRYVDNANKIRNAKIRFKDLKSVKKKKKFWGWGTDIRSAIVEAKKKNTIVFAKNLMTNKKITFVYLDEIDLIKIKKRLEYCLLAVQLNKPISGTGWCERNTSPQKDLYKKDVLYCTPTDIVPEKWVKDLFKDPDSYNGAYIGLLTQKNKNDKEILMENLKSMGNKDLTYWFAENAIGYALVLNPYKIINTDFQSIYIVLTCTSQDATFVVDNNEKLIVGIGSVMFTVISGDAYKKNYPVVSLRAANKQLINTYIKSGFHRSINVANEKEYPILPPTTIKVEMTECKDSKKKHLIDTEIMEGISNLDGVDEDVEWDGYFMTRKSAPSPY